MDHFLNDLAAISHHPYVLLIIVTALVFDYVNGFHDAANSIATVVGTRVLRPVTAVLWASFWNFGAMWIFGFHVANTVSKWVHIEFITLDVLFAALLGAVVWNLITWYCGLPSSSSHALLGGICGAAMTHAGRIFGVMNSDSVWKTVKFIVIAPVIGLVLGTLLITALLWTFRYMHPRRVDRWFRYVQIGSSALYSMGHGTNDAQKTMGIIAALLFSSIWTDQQAAFAAGKAAFPHWIASLCFITIGLGTLSGGWRIVKTMGLKITKLRPYSGACADIASASTLFFSTSLGIPVSTTHTVTGAIIGVGSVQRLSAVRWGVARNVVWAWILTIPAAAFFGSIFVLLIAFARRFLL
jgi:inorganic phosphate transporter, PiT family